MSITDANTPGVILHPNPNVWAGKYTQVRAHSPKLNWNDAEYDCIKTTWWLPTSGWCSPQSHTWIRQNAIHFAQQQQGKPYNWNFYSPYDPNRFYCSSLVWVAYILSRYNIVSGNSFTGSTISVLGIILPADVTNPTTTIMFNSSSI